MLVIHLSEAKMPIEVLGDRSRNMLLVPEDVLQGMTGRIEFLGEGALVEIGVPVHGDSLYVAAASRASVRLSRSFTCATLSLLARAVGSVIEVKEWVGFAGTVSLIVLEPGRIEVGAGCFFEHKTLIGSANTQRIFEVTSGDRIDSACDVVLGDRVWLRRESTVTRGVTIGQDCVLEPRSLANTSFGPNNLIGGNPARLLRPGIHWTVG